MADEGSDGADGAAEAPAKKKVPGKVLVLFVGGPIVLILLVLAVVFLFIGGDGGDTGEEVHTAEAGDPKAAKDAGDGKAGYGDGKEDAKGKGGKHDGGVPPLNPEDAIFFDLPDILVNLNATGKRQVYLKLRVSLELHKDAPTTELDASLPQVIDKFQVYLREMRVEDLSGSAGLFRLKEELLRRVNAATHPVHVYDVLFKEMLIQ